MRDAALSEGLGVTFCVSSSNFSIGPMVFGSDTSSATVPVRDGMHVNDCCIGNIYGWGMRKNGGPLRVGNGSDGESGTRTFNHGCCEGTCRGLIVVNLWSECGKTRDDDKFHIFTGLCQIALAQHFAVTLHVPRARCGSHWPCSCGHRSAAPHCEQSILTPAATFEGECLACSGFKLRRS